MESYPKNTMFYVAFPTGSILGPLLFIIYKTTFTTPGMFADDTYITTAHEYISTIDHECSSNSDLTAVHIWLKTIKLSCNISKISYLTIVSLQNLAKAKFMNVKMDDKPIEHKPSTKLLGFILMECYPEIIRSNLFHLKSPIACECCI